MNSTYSSHSWCRKGDRDESCRSLPSAHLNSASRTGDTKQLSRHRQGWFPETARVIWGLEVQRVSLLGPGEAIRLLPLLGGQLPSSWV